MSYNLDEQASEYFEFTLKGVNYRMRYPTTEEVDQGQKVEEGPKQTEWLYGFIEPVKEGDPSIGEALKTVNIKILSRFTSMIKTEFGGE